MTDEKSNLHEIVVEHFAIRAALGNNGGKWDEHYTEDQKNHWRTFVRELADAIAKAGPAREW